MSNYPPGMTATTYGHDTYAWGCPEGCPRVIAHAYYELGGFFPDEDAPVCEHYDNHEEVEWYPIQATRCDFDDSGGNTCDEWATDVLGASTISPHVSGECKIDCGIEVLQTAWRCPKGHLFITEEL